MLFGVTWPLLGMELLTYLVFLLCCVHAWRQGARRRERLALLLTGTVYGVTLETLTIFQLHAYYYGHFLIMFNNQVPLCIGMGWGIILYSSVAVADALRLNFASWVAVVGLLGLNIDLTMDAVAIRVGAWNWHGLSPQGGYTLTPGAPTFLLAPTVDWFGVPYGNFYAWFIVLTSASALFRWLRPGDAKTALGLVGRCALTLLGSVVVLTGLDEIYTLYFVTQWWPVALEVVGAVVVIVAGLRSRAVATRDARAADGIAPLAVPIFYHGYFLVVLAALAIAPALATRADMRTELAAQVPWLFAISGVMAVLGLGAHLAQRRLALPVVAPVPAPVATPVATPVAATEESQTTE